MSKHDTITLALDYQDKFNSALVNIRKDTGELKYKFEKLESDLAVSRSVNSKLSKKLVTLERQCWTYNQYKRRKYLKIIDEISGIPENIESKDLENLTLKIFEEIDINVDPANLENCHWV